MRDIRGDLEERVSLCQEQIRAAHATFDSMVHQLQRERDARIADLRAVYETIERLMDFENSHMGNVVTLQSSSGQLATLSERIKAANG